MVSSKLRHISDKIIIPIAKRFEKSRITPNSITVAGFFVMVASAVVISLTGLLQWPFWMLFVANALIIFSGFLDLLDGGVAKYAGKKTRFGGVLDSTMDRYSDGVVIIGLIFGGFLAPPAYIMAWDATGGLAATLGIILGFAGLVGAYMTSYVRSRAEVEGVVMAGVGWIERAERVVVIFIAIILEAALPMAGFLGLGVLFWAFLGLTVLMHVTATQRIAHAFKELKKEASESNSISKPENKCSGSA